MADKEQLKKEIEYYSALIQNHRKSQASNNNSTNSYHQNSQHAHRYIPHESSRYSLVRNIPPKTQPCHAGRSETLNKVPTSSRTVLPPQNKNASSRTVIPAGSLSNSRRTVAVSKPLKSSARTTDIRAVIKPSVSRPQVGSTSTRTLPLVATNSRLSSDAVHSTNRVNSNTSCRTVQALPSVHVNKLSSPSYTKTSTLPNAYVSPGAYIVKPLLQSTETNLPSTSGLKRDHTKTTGNKLAKNQGAAATIAPSKVHNKFIWVNSNILVSKNNEKVDKKTISTDSLSEANPAKVRKLDHEYILNTRYKLSKIPGATANTGPKSNNPKLKALGKYKLVRRSHENKAPIFTQRGARGKARSSPYLSRSGKRLVSRFKIRRKSLENRRFQSKTLSIYDGASPNLRKSGRKSASPYKIDRRKDGVLRSKYKIDKLKNSRKPVLHRTAAKITPDRRSLRWVRNDLKGSYPTFISPYKLSQRPSQLGANSARKGANSSLHRNWVVRQIASRSLQKSAALSLRAKYKKNNTNDKQCMFYMRFGRCKRGDKCYYIHDPDRVAVCSRYLRGTCTIDGCLFSHEARKEKVPVCQHFLRGCCLRDSCPYLHVNVGKDAPICKNFAQLRYCHLGERCKKLHTDICPNRDEDGKCPRGGKCRLWHPKKISKTSLRNSRIVRGEHQPETSLRGLQPDTSVAIDDQIMVPEGEKLTEALPAYISLTRTKTKGVTETAIKEVKILKKKPDFL